MSEVKPKEPQNMNVDQKMIMGYVRHLENANAEIQRLRAIVEGALRIKDLWLPSDKYEAENYGEAQALYKMKDDFENALTEAKHQAKGEV